MRRFFRLSAPILLLIASGADTAPSDAPATTPDPPAATPSTPTVLDGIKYTNLEQQGSLTRETCRTLGIPTIPIAYHGGVDTNADGTITAANITKFTQWVDRTIPPNRIMPAVLDYEQPWWDELTGRSIEPDRLQHILDVYLEGLAIAKKLRPDVQWGYWGLPAMRHVSSNWLEQGVSIESLMQEQDAVYPAAYDCNPDGDATEFGRYVERVLESTEGRRPVWVFINTRYCGQDGDRTMFIPVDELLANAEAILSATWNDPSGTEHRAAGIVVWDTYGWSDEDQWGALDRHNANLFNRLHALAEAMRTHEHTGQSRPDPPPVEP